MNFYFREASIEDAETLLEWRNDESTRKSSHNDEIIPLESHKSWLQEIIVSSDRFLYIVELDSESVGIVRKDRDENTWVISWTVSPSHRWHGYWKRNGQAILFLNTG
jgi:RimJ/RimL family protein N-acetyltransferase